MSTAQNKNSIVSSRRLGELLTSIDQNRLVVRPIFQRRLVWTNIVKDAFLDTVLRQFPFPEIFVAAGKLDDTKLQRTEWLVDGQQRLSTLREYVLGSKDLVLKKVKLYAELSEDEKTAFSDYPVSVRDLGVRSEEEVKEIFARINSADYSLKKIERLNAQYSGAFKQFCDELSAHAFFKHGKVFSPAAMRRMLDLDFCVILVITMITTYFHRDEKNDEYLRRYNDEFPDGVVILARLERVFQFIRDMNLFATSARAKKRTDLFTLLVELDVVLNRDAKQLDPKKVGDRLTKFYSRVDARYKQAATREKPNSDVDKYLKAATNATNDKYARDARAEVISHVIAGSSSNLKK